MASQQRRSLRSTTAMTPRASRHTKPRVSYRESSSEADSQITDTEDQAELDTSANGKLLNSRTDSQITDTTLPFQRRHRSRKSRRTSQPSEITLPSRKRSRPSESRTHQHATAKTIIPSLPMDVNNDGIVPLWASLPYEVLVSIFYYASYPLCDERTFQSTALVGWLVTTSRVCRAFAEPALTVLYRSPPLVPMDRAHKLRQLLVADPVPMSYNYRAKVERLQMEVSQTAAYTLAGSGLLDLYGLIYNCPRLLDLELYHQKDFSPYRRLDDPIKWTYPDSLFVALGSNVTGSPTRLRSWRWSSRLAGKKRPVESLLEIHQTPAFSMLRKIAFVNYQKIWARKNVEDPGHERLLAETLSVLLGLEHLVFESSTLVNSIILPLLPNNLKYLEITNCSEIDSDDLAKFLTSHGSQLRTLTLNHNISLSISFLTVLGNSCQKLESLRMNLTYYNAHSTYRDSDPGYDVLLGIDEKPCWPSSLRTLELTQLRRWEIETAKMFFQSLLDSAPILADLRRLVIKATLNTSWRDRSSFRDEWIGAFDRVFKRQAEPPNPVLTSLGNHAAQARQSRRSSGLESSCSDDDTSQSNGNALRRPSKYRRLAKDGEENGMRSQLHRTPRLAKGNPLLPAEDGNNSPGGNHRGGGYNNNDTKEQIHASNTRRSTRVVPNKQEPKDIAVEPNLRIKDEMHHSANSSNNTTKLSFRESKRNQTLSRELEVLRKTAGADGPNGDVSVHTSDHGARSDYNRDSESLSLAITQNSKKGEYIQGMCDVVSITIDNLRPTENQFVEADFLDSEPEGDEDWDGSEDVTGEGRYAW